MWIDDRENDYIFILRMTLIALYVLFLLFSFSLVISTKQEEKDGKNTINIVYHVLRAFLVFFL